MKMMTSSKNAWNVSVEDKFPCAVCREGVGSNSIISQICRCWVDKRFSGIKGKLKGDSRFKCHTSNQQIDIAGDSPDI